MPDSKDRVATQAIELAAELQEQLDELREQLAWSNRLGQLGMLTAQLAHETKNLLTPIRSYAQLALANPDDARLTGRALQTAVDSTGKANRLIERVMELASPGQAEKASSCQVHDVVEEAIACMLPTAKEHRVNLLSRVEPCEAGIDGLALEQVLINLLSNGCQAMSEAEGRRQIMIESRASNDCLMLVVSDTGPGIPEPIRGKVFDPFVTTGGGQRQGSDPADGMASAQGSTPKKGSGLGLSICKQLIGSAGGTIRLADSQQGACFEITLPRVGAG